MSVYVKLETKPFSGTTKLAEVVGLLRMGGMMEHH